MESSFEHDELLQKTSSSKKRGFFIILLLFGLLIVINLFYEPVSRYQPILDGKAGDLLYVSAFDGFVDEWQQYDGRLEARVNGGGLTIGVDEAGAVAWSASTPHYVDFDVEVEAGAIGGIEDNGFGIIFRLQTEQSLSCDLPLVILCGMEDLIPALRTWRLILPTRNRIEGINHYKFLISSDGFYSVWRIDNGDEKRLSAWIQSPLINTGISEKNTIRVIGRGDQFQFFINDEQVDLCIPNDPKAISTFSGGECIEGRMVDTLVDDTISSGQLAMVAQTSQFGTGTVVRFDNVIVFSPQAIGTQT